MDWALWKVMEAHERKVRKDSAEGSAPICLVIRGGVVAVQGFPRQWLRWRDCSDYYLLQRGDWGPETMEPGKNREG